jgi:hypothetical protein
MNQVMQLPFQSYNRLKRWYETNLRESNPETEYHNRCLRIYYEGMKHWFENMPASVRVFDYDNGRQGQYADVQLEIPVGGQPSQVYLMTLVTPRLVSEKWKVAGDFGLSELDFGCPIEEVADPFSNPTVIWECPSLTPDEIVKAVQAWSDKFWPDFECDYTFEAVEEGMSDAPLDGDFRDWEEFDRMTEPQLSHCRVLLQCEASQVETIEEWALSEGCSSVYVSQSHMVLLDGLPRESLPTIKNNWPDCAFAVATPST